MDTNLCRCQEGEQEKTEERIKVHLDECETRMESSGNYRKS